MSEPDNDRELSPSSFHMSGLLRRSAPMDEHDELSPPGGANDPAAIDRHVGCQIARRREALNISLASLARRLSVSLRVISAYETGTIRVGGERLLEIAGHLSVAPSYFFQDHEVSADSGMPNTLADQRAEVLDKYLIVLDSLMIGNILKNMNERTARLRVIDFAIQVSKELSAEGEGSKPDRRSGEADGSQREDRNGRA